MRKFSTNAKCCKIFSRTANFRKRVLTDGKGAIVAAGMDDLVSTADREVYRRDGAVCLRGLFAEAWVAALAAGVAHNRAEPGPMATHYTDPGRPGGYFGDYCNWRRVTQFRDFVFGSPAAAVAAALMDSRTVQFFHEHVLVKDAGTEEETPWHHDQPYYVVDGRQVVSLWVPLDPVPRAVCPRFVAGSHRWGKLFYPRRFKDGVDYDYAGDGFERLPDIDAGDHTLLAWDLAPGDAIAFHFLTVHDAPANRLAQPRRVISFRWLGDDARYAERPGVPSPPYPEMGIALKTGERMRTDWFPVVWPVEARTEEAP